MLRELKNHVVAEDLSPQLKLEAEDGPGPGGASHLYRISFSTAGGSCQFYTKLGFQYGPVLEGHVNGITHEALLAILIDRLRGFQAGPFSCRENAIALTKIEEALMWLQQRTRNRIARLAEGQTKI